MLDVLFALICIICGVICGSFITRYKFSKKNKIGYYIGVCEIINDVDKDKIIFKFDVDFEELENNNYYTIQVRKINNTLK